MRYGFDGLAAQVAPILRADPLSGELPGHFPLYSKQQHIGTSMSPDGKRSAGLCSCGIYRYVCERAANQAWRRAETSGRSCSAACAVFLTVMTVRQRQTVLVQKEAPCSLRMQSRQLDPSDVFQHCDRRRIHAAECFDAVRTCVAALRSGHNGARRVDGLLPAHGDGGRHQTALPRHDETCPA
jgi:hypothetical protein